MAFHETKSFSYKEKDSNFINAAQKYCNEKDISFSNYLISLIKKDQKIKKFLEVKK